MIWDAAASSLAEQVCHSLSTRQKSYQRRKLLKLWVIQRDRPTSRNSRNLHPTCDDQMTIHRSPLVFSQHVLSLVYTRWERAVAIQLVYGVPDWTYCFEADFNCSDVTQSRTDSLKCHNWKKETTKRLGLIHLWPPYVNIQNVNNSKFGIYWVEMDSMWSKVQHSSPYCSAVRMTYAMGGPTPHF